MRIGVLNTAFLGDAVLTLPLLQNLKKKFKAAEIDFYVRGGLSPLFENHPAISRVFSYDKREGQKGFTQLASFARHIQQQHYDVWISPHTSLRSSILAKFSNAPVRVGYKEAALAKLCYTHIVPRCFKELAEIERILNLLRPLDVQPEEVWPEIFLPTKDMEKATEFFKVRGKPVLGLHPGSTWATKCWPAEYFAEIGARAVQAGATVVVFAGRGEELVAQEVINCITSKIGYKLCSERVYNLAGSLSLTELACFIGGLDCYVTNDSGPMHIAWASHIPVIAIFGPTITEFGFAPRGKSSVVHQVELPCRPCSLHGPQVCPLGHHNCMKFVLPDMVWNDVLRFLNFT